MAKIMVVDDEPSLLMIMERVLNTKKHEVVTFQDSGEAKERIESKDERFDLLLSDVRMSPVDGMELLRCAKKSRPDMNVIMITAYHSPEKSAEAQKQGAFAYLAKPFSLENMLSTIEHALPQAS